jgi:hypothetical protein
MSSVILAVLIAALVASPALAQANCNARLVEQQLQRDLEERFGPSPNQIIQSFSTIARAPVTKVNVVAVQALGTIPPNGIRCSATVSIWREDTGQTIQTTARYSVYDQPNGIGYQFEGATK